MGFMDELRKLTQPYDDDDDFFEDADSSLRQPGAAQIEFEDTFAGESAARPETTGKPAREPSESGGLFGALGHRRQNKAKAAPRRERVVDIGGSEKSVILFSPKTFEEAGDLVNYLLQNRSVVMTLEGVSMENARRLLDFLSGITYALQGKITPISAKTYCVTPQDVDIVGLQPDQPENSGQYL